MGRLRRPPVPKEPVRTVEAVVVARSAEPPRAENEATHRPENQPPAVAAETPRVPPPAPATLEPVLEPAGPDDTTIVGKDDAQDVWLEEEVSAAQLRAAPAPPVASTAEPSIAVPAAHYPVYADEDVHAHVPATVDTTSCRIAVWRGYRKATFYAQVFDSRGAELAVAESPSFRYRGNGMPEETEAAAEAHRALVERLRHGGWEPARNGTSWFDLTFTRR